MTILLHDYIIALLYWHVTMSLFYSFSIYYFIILLYYNTTILQYYNTTILQYYNTIILVYYYITIWLYYFIRISLSYYISRSPCSYFTIAFSYSPFYGRGLRCVAVGAPGAPGHGRCQHRATTCQGIPPHAPHAEVREDQHHKCVAWAMGTQRSAALLLAMLQLQRQQAPFPIRILLHCQMFVLLSNYNFVLV